MPQTFRLRSLAAALLTAGALAAPPAQAGEPVARIDRLTGQLLAVRDDGRPRSLSAASRVGAGDRLSTLPGSYARVALDNGTVLTVGPATTLVVAQATATATVLQLAQGQLQLDAPSTPRTGHRVTVRAGDATVEGGDARYTIGYVPAAVDPARHVAWLRSSLAAAGAGPLTDSPADGPLHTVVAQLAIPAPAGTSPGPLRPPTGSLAPGLYVQVIDGQILVSNSAGAQSFSAGQFGYTSGLSKPPVVVPVNPGLTFNPPPVFSATGTTSAGSPPKSNVIDCEVR